MKMKGNRIFWRSRVARGKPPEKEFHRSVIKEKNKGERQKKKVKKKVVSNEKEEHAQKLYSAKTKNVKKAFSSYLSPYIFVL